MDENVEYEEREDEFDIVSDTIAFPDFYWLISIWQEDEAVQFERKMKAEEEEVDIDTILTGAEAVHGSKGTQSGNMGGAATPVGQGNGTMMDLDKLGSGNDETDIETTWAEEEPDLDILGGWKMKVVMEATEDYWWAHTK